MDLLHCHRDSWDPQPRCSAAGWNGSARASPCSRLRCASAADSCVSAVGIHLHQLWLLYLGYGVLGGCGLGIGYISPVSTLIKWFPDRPGMATGMAIMGFGGGALIAAPLSVMLMAHFKTAASNGVLETFVTMGVIYFMFMMIGVYTVRVPAADWKPAGWIARARSRNNW